MSKNIEIYPETRVAYVVGTNVAFINADDAVAFVGDNTLRPSTIEQPGKVQAPLAQVAIVMMPVCYLAKDTQVVYGAVPPHKPAAVKEVEDANDAPQQTSDAIPKDQD